MRDRGRTMIVTIDGPAGAGKSTVAKALARKLGYFYLDTGAMYRALTLKAVRAGADLDSEPALVELAEDTVIEFVSDKDGAAGVMLDGENVSQEIRTPEVTNKTSLVARKKGVRQIMVGWQRSIGEKNNVVIEGRDVGTVVFPHAAYKFFLEADLDERAKRRLLELQEEKTGIDAEALRRDMESRDQSDIRRDVGPLKKAEDAVVIDSTGLTAEEVVEQMLRHIQK